MASILEQLNGSISAKHRARALDTHKKLITPAGVVIFWIQIQDQTKQHIAMPLSAELRVNQQHFERFVIRSKQSVN